VGAIGQLARFVTETKIGDVHPDTVDHLRLHLFDTLGAAIVGGATAEGKAVAGLVEDLAGPGSIVAAGLPVRTSPPLAALATCAAIRCTEIDDIHMESCTTPASIVVPVALALAQCRPQVDTNDFLAAILVGYEMLARLGKAASGPVILYRGIWPTYLSGAFGSAATAARLLGLSGDETAHALAVALTLTTGTRGRITGLSSRWLTLGCAAQNGILAALAARRKLRGDLLLLESDWDKTVGIALDHEQLLDALGDSYEIDRASIKPYCAAKQTISAIDGFVQLLDQERLDPAAIERIVVAVPKHFVSMIDQAEAPAYRQASIVSVQYQLALAAYHRSELLDVLRPDIHREQEFRALMTKISVEADESLHSYYPRAWPSRVEVYTPSGKLTREVRHSKGDPSNPLNWDEVNHKLWSVVRGIAKRSSVDRLASACQALGAGVPLADFLTAVSDATQEVDD